MNAKKFFVGISISLFTIIVLLILLLCYDLHLNKRFHARGSFNYRGYRGEIVGRKKSNEIRIGIFGGSVAMGYGVHHSKSIPALLEKFINSKNFKKKYTVINLAAAGESLCYFLKDTYKLFEYLNIDVIVFYFTDESFQDKIAQNQECKRSTNSVLKKFHYYFVFPTVLQEKYYLIRYGNISRGYREDKIFKAIDGILQRTHSPVAKKDKENLPDFVHRLTSQGKIFIFALSSDEIYDDKIRIKELKSYLMDSFADNPRLIIIELKDVFPKDNRSVYFLDSLHYNEKGNQVIVEELFKYIPFNILENEV